MNDTTLLDFCEGGAKDGIQKYSQDLRVSASRELTNVNERQRAPQPCIFPRARQTIVIGSAKGSAGQQQRAFPVS
jgi:hypothetical protein